MNLEFYKDNSLYLKKFIGGLLSGIGSIIGSGISAGANAAAVNATNKANILINRENNQFNHDENTLAYNRQRQLINEQNDYNSFSNQRTLMEQAGYNPNNLVGGTAGTAVSSSGTNVGAASASPSHGMIAPDFSALGNIANIGLTTAQTALANAQAKKANAEADEVHANSESQRYLNSVTSQLTQTQKDSLDRDIQQKDRNIKLFDATFESQVKHINLLNDLTSEQADNFKAQSESIRQHLKIDNGTFAYMLNTMWPAQVKEIMSRTGLNQANATAALCNAYYMAELGDYTLNQNRQYRSTVMQPEYQAAVVDRAVGEAEYWKSRGQNETDGIPYVQSVGRSYSSNFKALGIGGGATWQTHESYNPVTNTYQK